MATPTNKPMPEVRGVVIAVAKEMARYDATYWKREVVIDIGQNGAEEPLPIVFELEAADEAAGLRVGECVTIAYEPHGRKWNGPKGTRYFATLVGRRIGRETPSATTPETYSDWAF